MCYVWGAEVFPTDIRSNGMAVASMTARIGGVIAPQLPQALSPAYSFLFLTFFAILAVFGRNTK